MIILILGCNRGAKDKDFLPESIGKTGEILVVTDSLVWASDVGYSLRAKLLTFQEGLPQQENIFSIKYTTPRLFFFNKFLKLYRSIIFIEIGENESETKRLFEKIFKKNEKGEINTVYSVKKINEVFAKNQLLLFCHGKTEEDLIEYFTHHSHLITNHINENDDRYLISKLINDQSTKRFNDITRERNFHILIPKGYNVVIDSSDIIWWRYFEDVKDKNIFIAIKPYTKENQFNKDSILLWRNKIGKRYILGSDNMNSFMTIQKEYPVNSKTISFKGNYGLELRGVWKLNNNMMGGPFVSYTVAWRDKIYYIEGFLYGPGKPKREILKELEAICKSIQFI